MDVITKRTTQSQYEEDYIINESLSRYRALPYSGQDELIRCALKSILFSYFHNQRTHVGFITERQSLWLLIQSGLSNLCTRQGLAFVSFRGIHTLVFTSLAAGRVRISADCYVDFFLPRFTMELSKTMKAPHFTVESMYATLLDPVVDNFRLIKCGLREKLIVSCIMNNRQLFGIAGRGEDDYGTISKGTHGHIGGR
ncbi:unnamed protein product [Echinostoma caproni]|uniref:SH2 domain-containing protein n=1 Tax=Echinostoma caproni TaxID=27848 RepID=A0A183B6T3_9TREM|nr:unnamed protein product [Echinostoma caproni]